jgi:hypothetical protein
MNPQVSVVVQVNGNPNFGLDLYEQILKADDVSIRALIPAIGLALQLTDDKNVKSFQDEMDDELLEDKYLIHDWAAASLRPKNKGARMSGKIIVSLKEMQEIHEEFGPILYELGYFKVWEDMKLEHVPADGIGNGDIGSLSYESEKERPFFDIVFSHPVGTLSNYFMALVHTNSLPSSYCLCSFGQGLEGECGRKMVFNFGQNCH